MRDDMIGNQFNQAIVSGAETGTQKLVADSIRFPAGRPGVRVTAT